MKIPKRRSKARKRVPKAKPIGVAPSYELEPLNPWLMCGPDTTVTELWKVQALGERGTAFHLVYFDRYGWYCEHGRSCKAVTEVRRVLRTMSANAPRPKSSGKARARKRK
jgi:hypothetical protein